MCIAINDIIGSKRIDLSYPIHSDKKARRAPHAEIAVVSLFSDNIQYNLLKPCIIIDDISGDKN